MTEKPLQSQATLTIDYVELCRAGTHYTEKRGNFLHILESATGKTICILPQQGSTTTPLKLQEVELEDGTRVWTHDEALPHIKRTQDVLFNPIIVDQICQEIVSGKGLTEICKQTGFPSYVTFTRWRREHSWINDALDKAREDRAEHYRDQVLAEARAAVSTKDSINATNTKIEALKWAAGVDNQKYSPKAKFEATLNTPTQIIVSTGIDRTRVVDPLPESHDVTPKNTGVADDKGS